MLNQGLDVPNCDRSYSGRNRWAVKQLLNGRSLAGAKNLILSFTELEDEWLFNNSYPLAVLGKNIGEYIQRFKQEQRR